MKSVEYDSNNSGGSWWLTDEDWHNLEAAGWDVEWVKDRPYWGRNGEDRWLGALATSATRHGLSMDEAIAEFEEVTGQGAYEAGCECCGPPHNFYERDAVIDTTGSVVDHKALDAGVLPLAEGEKR